MGSLVMDWLRSTSTIGTRARGLSQTLAWTLIWTSYRARGTGGRDAAEARARARGRGLQGEG